VKSGSLGLSSFKFSSTLYFFIDLDSLRFFLLRGVLRVFRVKWWLGRVPNRSPARNRLLYLSLLRWERQRPGPPPPTAVEDRDWEHEMDAT